MRLYRPNTGDNHLYDEVVLETHEPIVVSQKIAGKVTAVFELDGVEVIEIEPSV